MTFFFPRKICSFIEKKKICALIFYGKNSWKHLAIAVKYVKDGENIICFIKVVEILDGKADTIFSALINEIEKCGRVGSVMIRHKEIVSKLKMYYHKIISIHCHNHRLALGIHSFFKANAFLMK